MFGGFTPDGRRSIVSMDTPTGSDLATITWQDPASDDPRPGPLEPWLASPANEQFPAMSPDGRWVAYTSDESGKNQLYVRPFPGPGGKWQVSTDGGLYPEWSHKGNELFFLSPNSILKVVSYTVKGDAFVRGEERVKFPKPISRIGGLRNYSSAPDGKQFVVLLPPDAQEGAPLPRLTFLVNFTDELERRFALAATKP